MINYDKVIGSIIRDWIYSNSSKYFPIKLGLSKSIIVKLYNSIRVEILDEKPYASKKLRSKFNSVKQVLNYIYWFCLWTVKWIFKRKLIKDKIVLTTLISDRKLSFEYVDLTLKFCSLNNSTIISLTLLQDYSFLKNPSIFYYPRFLYIFFNLVNLRFLFSEYKTIQNELENAIAKEIKIAKAKFRMDHFSMFIDKITFENMLTKILLDKEILFLLQDLHHTSNKSIYALVSKENKIKTIVADHAFTLYNHIYDTVPSDYYLVWGEYEKERITKISASVPKSISVVGRPKSHKFTITEEKPYWIYFLSSFNSPTFQTIHRSLEETTKNIKRISEIQNKYFSNYRFYLREHPGDIDANFFSEIEKIKANLNDFLPKVKLAFVEESSIFVELLKTDCKIIYLQDKNGNDPYNLKKFNTATLVGKSDELFTKISESLNSQIDFDLREKHYNYFIRTNEEYEKSFINELKNIASQ